MLITYEFYRHDISASHVDPAIKFILEACIAENDADRHITNIKVSYIYKDFDHDPSCITRSIILYCLDHNMRFIKYTDFKLVS